jgi:ketosteroid isomerase-like protein
MPIATRRNILFVVALSVLGAGVASAAASTAKSAAAASVASGSALVASAVSSATSASATSPVAAPAPASRPDSPPCAAFDAGAEKAAILKVITDMQAAWNRGDFRGYMQGFKNPDVIFVSGGRFQEGWQGTLDHYIRDYGASPEMRGTLRFSDIRIEILGPDAAQLISRYQLVRQQHPQYGINTRLMRKVNGQWVIALNHVSSSETAPIETLKENH